MNAHIHADRLINRLGRFEQALPAVVGVLDSEGAHWRPTDGAWSVIEIVSHLADEEVDDFRARTLMTLQDPEQDWPPIDPQGWAAERDYRSRNLGVELERFVRERADSVAMLRSLADPDWSRTHTHPKLGPMSAGQLLACWCAHDALHLRQISKRLYQLAQRDLGSGVSVAYAGDW